MLKQAQFFLWDIFQLFSILFQLSLSLVECIINELVNIKIYLQVQLITSVTPDLVDYMYCTLWALYHSLKENRRKIITSIEHTILRIQATSKHLGLFT